jgi:hypothetical protein
MRDLAPGFFPLPRELAIGGDPPRRGAAPRFASVAAAIEEQRACWLARARPGGLADSVARLERAQAELGA